MAYRGRLIFPFLLEIAQLDLEETAAAGYDADFKEPLITPTDDGVGESTRTETLVRVKASLHTPQSSFTLTQGATGNLARSSIMAVFHFEDLEEAGLVEETTGTALIKVGDRLNAIFTLDGELIQKFPDPPGLYVDSASPQFGLNSARNLLEVIFNSNDPGPSSSGG